MHTTFIGPSGIPPINVAKKVESGAWGIPHGAGAHHASSDASLFSSSLPVLPHEKCKPVVFLYMQCWSDLVFFLMPIFLSSLYFFVNMQ